MNENSMDNGAIRGRHSFTDQHPHIDNEQLEDSTQNQSAPARSDNVTEKRKKLPMNPTPLYIIFFSSQSSSCIKCCLLGNIHVGQGIDLQQLWVRLLSSQV